MTGRTLRPTATVSGATVQRIPTVEEAQLHCLAALISAKGANITTVRGRSDLVVEAYEYARTLMDFYANGPPAPVPPPG